MTVRVSTVEPVKRLQWIGTVGSKWVFKGRHTSLIIKATDEGTDGSFSMVEQLAPAGFSPPLHVHHEDDELFYVLSGRVTFEIGDERITATPGSTVYAPHGVPHSHLIEEEAPVWS